ncbi:MAG: hypothetical protein HN550_01535, partial [Deltaproteobacteria bacterium]|nr:hypothetical protein [Deltaproteobacteria bacterium]
TPFIPNIGYSSVSFKDKETIGSDNDTSSVLLETATTIKTINLFYNVPFPVVTITVGFGLGGVETKTTIDENNDPQDTSDLKTSVTEGFLHIGLPFWNTVEFHLGYHLMSFTSIDLTSNKSGGNFEGTYNTKKNYSGGMTTIGVQVAF